VTEPQEDTPQTEPGTDEETQIAEQMTPDEGETPDVVAPNPDEEEVTPTGPGPESPFQPPELNPDDEPEPDEPEKLEDYARGVAEARLLSEREAEALGKKLDAERKRHGKRVMELLGDDLGGHIPCPTCMDGIDGFIISPEFAPLAPEMRERMLQVLGMDDWEQLPTADWAVQCETCKGYGRIKTKSHVQGSEVTGCEDCSHYGWINLRTNAAGNGHKELATDATTGPTVTRDSAPDERVNSLRADGWTVIPPMPMAVGD
jgi:ribosome-binding protein aMBF1 (putative translation factor)